MYLKGDSSSDFSRTAAETIWLHADALPHEERLARLLGDERLLADLAASDFAGPDWDFVEEQLLRYGLTVISSWIRSGLIVSKCAEKGVHARTPPLAAREPDTAVEVTLDVISVAIVRFRDDVLLPRRYDPRKGASLGTYFIGQCLFRYDNVMAKWENHEKPIPRIGDEGLEEDLLDARSRLSVEDDVIRTETVRIIRAGASTNAVARMLAMAAMGYSMKDIADDAGRSVESVRSLVKRERTALRERFEKEGLG